VGTALYRAYRQLCVLAMTVDMVKALCPPVFQKTLDSRRKHAGMTRWDNPDLLEFLQIS